MILISGSVYNSLRFYDFDFRQCIQEFTPSVSDPLCMILNSHAPSKCRHMVEVTLELTHNFVIPTPALSTRVNVSPVTILTIS